MNLFVVDFFCYGLVCYDNGLTTFSLKFSVDAEKTTLLLQPSDISAQAHRENKFMVANCSRISSFLI